MRSFLQEVKHYVGFSETDSGELSDLIPILEPHFGSLVDDFYSRIDTHPDARRAITGGRPQIERLKQTLIEWLRSGLEGPHDEAFFQRRAKIGRRHVRIALPQRYMLTAMNGIREGIHEIIARELAESPQRKSGKKAVDRLLDIELAIMLETYKESSEERLREIEQARGDARVRTLVDTVQALLLVLDGDGTILQANATVATVLGVSVAELEGKNWFDCCTYEIDRERARADFAQLVAGDQTLLETRERLSREGTSPSEARWIDWQSAVVRGPDSVRVYRSGLDVTRARELEQRTRVAERLAAVGTLAAGLAHEIRNPLNAAGLQLQLLERRLRKAGVEDETAGPVQIVQSEVDRLSRLVQDFLSFARPVDLRRSTLDLREVASSVVRLTGPDAEARGLVLELFNPEQELPVDGDAHQLGQVLLNLVRNAMEALEGSGRIEVRTFADHEGVHLTVKDDGPGIPLELQPRIFEPFFSTREAGTGLGLSISHAVVAQHGGELRLRVELGTEFDILLPAL